MEDVISDNLRLGITTILLSAIIMATVLQLEMARSAAWNIFNNIAAVADDSTLKEITGLQDVSGAQVYKVIEANRNYIRYITWGSKKIYTDYMSHAGEAEVVDYETFMSNLLKNQDAFFTVRVTQTGGYYYLDIEMR